MPVDVKEYTNCADVIQQALLAEVGVLHGNGGSGQGGGSFLPTWLIVVLALLLVGGVGFGVYAWRQRGVGPPCRLSEPGPLYTPRTWPQSARYTVGGVPIGGGAPVVVQTMTKTETADLAATMKQVRDGRGGGRRHRPRRGPAREGRRGAA